MFGDIVKVTVIGIFTVVTALLIKNTRSEIAIPITVVGCILILGVVTSKLSSIIGSLSGIYQSAGIKGDEVVTLFKIMGIAFVTEFAASTCRDAQESAVASKIELAGRVFIVYLSLPLAVSLLSTIKNLF